MKINLFTQKTIYKIIQKFRLNSIVLILIFLFQANFTQAANYTPVINGDFNTISTWGGSSIPTSSDNINYAYWGSTDVNRLVYLTADAEVSDVVLKGSHLSLTLLASTPTTITINKLTIKNDATFVVGENVTLIVEGTTSLNTAVFVINDGGIVVFNSNVTSSGGGAEITVESSGSFDVNGTFNITGGATNVELFGTMELDELSASGGSQRVNVYEGGILNIINDAKFSGSAGFTVQNLGVVNVQGDFTMSGGATGVVDGVLNIAGILTVPNYTSPTVLTVNATGSVSAGTILGNSIAGAGLIQEGVTLPIELAYFHARIISSRVSLTWETESELNNDYFSIERSEDAVNYYTIATFDGAGTSYAPLTYSAIDNNPVNGTNYYRLKQTDYNGDYSYSPVQSVNITVYSIQDIKEVTIYPNPIASPNYLLTLDIPGDYYNEYAIIKVFAMNGQEVIEYEIALEGAFNKTAIDISNMKTGNYMLIVLTSSNSFKNKLVVL